MAGPEPDRARVIMPPPLLYIGALAIGVGLHAIHPVRVMPPHMAPVAGGIACVLSARARGDRPVGASPGGHEPEPKASHDGPRRLRPVPDQSQPALPLASLSLRRDRPFRERPLAFPAGGPSRRRPASWCHRPGGAVPGAEVRRRVSSVPVTGPALALSARPPGGAPS